MKIQGDNFEIDLVNGRVRLGLYSPEDKATIQMSVSLPDQQSEDTVGVLDKLQNLLTGVELMIERAKKDFKKPEG